MTVYAKDPNASLDYRIDWTGYLQSGETLTSSNWQTAPSDTITLSDPVEEATASAITLSGGIAGRMVRLTNRVTTSLGRVDERSLAIRIVDR